jgi:predicted TIM-barrel fold metal-dependent hydrolase
VVGSADLFSPDAMSVLRAQAAVSPLVRGTRLQLHWHPREEFRFAASPDALLDPVLVRNVGRLSELGWLFELQVFADQMPAAAELVAACPDTTFVLVHVPMLVDAWRDALSSRSAEEQQWIFADNARRVYGLSA